MRRPLRASAALVVALAAALAGGCPSEASEPRALLWSVSDADNTVYLLGSFHALRADDYPLDPAVDAALADAEQLAFELSPAEMESPELAAMMMRAATLPEGEDLRSTLPPATFARLEAYAQSRGLPLPALMQREPWFVALLVSLGEMQRIGLDPEQGLDRKLMAQAAAAGKPGTGLETAAEQLAALDSMTPAEQQQALDEALTGVDDMRREMDELHGLWRRGDADALYSKMGTELRDRYPLLYQRINVDRNNAWLPKVQAMLDGEREKDALVVVGSLHLLGDEGLVARLKAKGYKVERLPRGG